MENLKKFNSEQIGIVNNAAGMAEELVNDAYKISTNQWRGPRYDIKTLADLCNGEIVYGPFAQIIRYEGQINNSHLISSTYDFYKICLQDHSILSLLKQKPRLRLFPFVLYTTIHELVHIVRFSKFLQAFDASYEEKFDEETRVHKKTHEILAEIQIDALENVLRFHSKWLTHPQRTL
jgi:hypothetical protein